MRTAAVMQPYTKCGAAGSVMLAGVWTCCRAFAQVTHKLSACHAATSWMRRLSFVSDEDQSVRMYQG